MIVARTHLLAVQIVVAAELVDHAAKLFENLFLSGASLRGPPAFITKNVQVVDSAARSAFLGTKFCTPSPVVALLTFTVAPKAFPDFALADLWL